MPLPRVHTACAVVAFAPVFLTQIINTDFATTGRRMHKLMIAQINPHMRKSASHGIEKNQIAGLKLILPNLRPLMADFPRATGKQGSHAAIHMRDKPATVETGFRRTPPAMVTDTQQPERMVNHLIHAAAGAIQQRRLIGELLPGHLEVTIHLIRPRGRDEHTRKNQQKRQKNSPETERGALMERLGWMRRMANVANTLPQRVMSGRSHNPAF